MNKFAKKWPIIMVILTVVGCDKTDNLIDVDPKASEYVTLELIGGANGGCGPALLDFVRILPDGSPSGIFRVPTGKILIVTDVDWQYATHGLFNTDKVQTLRLIIASLTDPTGVGSSVFESTITLNDDGNGGLSGGISEHLTTGFLISSQARICPEVFPGPTGPPAGLQHLILRGYLITDN